MEEVRVTFEEGGDIELDEIDVGVAEGVVAFDVSGRIVGLDEETLSQLSGKQLTPIELVLETQEVSSG